MTVRVRFAPSPTGFLHIGGARTALYNWLFARKNGGAFVLRIEDTDAERSTDESTAGILDGMKWMGIDWDEGPFYQSEYLQEHKDAAQELLRLGAAYRCFCTKEELDQQRAEARANKVAFKYNRKCLALSAEESQARADRGDPYVIRFRVPDNRQETVSFDDRVFGHIEVGIKEIGDFVIVRSNGLPLYNLANVVDDHRDRITHVMRGADGLANTPKQVLIYEALGWETPVFAHMALTLDPSKAKISKRRHGEVVTVEFYQEHGFLPWAFCNFMALLGWSSGDDQEIFLNREEMIDRFSLDHVSKANSVFNYRKNDPKFITDPKALAVNAAHLRQLPIDELLPYVKDWFVRQGLWKDDWDGADRQWFASTVDLIRSRYHTLEDFTELGRAYFFDEYPIVPKAAKNIRKDPVLEQGFKRLSQAYAALDGFSLENVESTLRVLSDDLGIKAGLLINGVRAAVTGQTVGPSLFEVLLTLGKERVISRLEKAAVMVSAG
ncbi:MAG: glutamate--tRNA ligase [Deltaproteobacteria bacterium]|nr:glutamate--tRNA ligase [Deltaproteobacteria bacterium]